MEVGSMEELLARIVADPKDMALRWEYAVSRHLAASTDEERIGYRSVRNNPDFCAVRFGMMTLVYVDLMVEIVYCTLDDWRIYGKGLVAKNPLIRKVCISDKRPVSDGDLFGGKTYYGNGPLLRNVFFEEAQEYFGEFAVDPMHRIPAWIWETMCDATDDMPIPEVGHDYRVVMDILSGACLKWARTPEQRYAADIEREPDEGD